jgi:hypothetical protein
VLVDGLLLDAHGGRKRHVSRDQGRFFQRLRRLGVVAFSTHNKSALTMFSAIPADKYTQHITHSRPQPPNKYKYTFEFLYGPKIQL